MLEILLVKVVEKQEIDMYSLVPLKWAWAATAAAAATFFA